MFDPMCGDTEVKFLGGMSVGTLHYRTRTRGKCIRRGVSFFSVGGSWTVLSKRMTGVCCLSCRVRDAGYAHEDDVCCV